MIRKIIHIDEAKCNGCGLCASACHEGAIDIIDGKAKLVREHFCDGLGDCLPACPTGAITFEEREAPRYDEQAVLAEKERKEREGQAGAQIDLKGFRPAGGCPGARMMQLNRAEERSAFSTETAAATTKASAACYERPASQLGQWPCQIKLVPTKAPFFDGAKLLIAADCTAYAYANMHEDFMKGKITIIGCPKLDAVDYSEKLTEIIRDNDIKSVTIVRMEVPCCGGIQRAAGIAIQASGKFIPWQVVTISRDGRILD